MTVDLTAIAREIHIDARPEIVYALLTDPERVVRWMGRSVRLEPRPVGLIRVDMNGFDIMRGVGVEAVPCSRLVYTMGWESLEDDAVRPGTSTVAFTLTPVGEGTHVRFVHSGLPALARQPHADGWDFFLPRLAAVAGGRAVEAAPPAGSQAETLASRLNSLLVEATEVIEACPAGRWGAPTAAEGWSVAAVAGHLAGHIGVAHAAADVAHERETPVARITAEMLDAGNAAAAAAFVDPGPAATVATIRAEGRKAVAAVRTLADADLRRTANMALAGGRPVTAGALLEGLLSGLRSHLDSIIATCSGAA